MSNCVWVKYIATHAALLLYYALALFLRVGLALELHAKVRWHCTTTVHAMGTTCLNILVTLVKYFVM